MNNKVDRNKYHWRIATVQVVYDQMVGLEDGRNVRANQPRTKTMNVIMQLPEKFITQHDLNTVQKAAMHKMEAEFNIVPPHYVFLDCIFISSTYLGLMDQKTFMTPGPETEQSEPTPFDA